jgi:hypothetical protein
MDDDTGWLIDHEEVLVLVPNKELNVLGNEFHGRFRDQADLYALTLMQAIALWLHTAVDRHAATGEETFRGRTRADLGQIADEPIEPLARTMRVDGRREGLSRRLLRHGR